MKNRFVTLIIQAIANIGALWFVFVKKNSWFVSVLTQLGVDNPKAQVGILGAITLLVATSTVIFLEWLTFEIFFKPVKIDVGFRNPSGKNSIKNLSLKYDSSNMVDIQAIYKLHVSISDGNKITNKILNFIKSDLIIIYRPKYYDTEITNGWLSQSTMNIENVYKDKHHNARIYWTHTLEDASNIEKPLISMTEFIVKPKTFEAHKCQLEVKIGSHSKSHPFWRFIFNIIYFKLVKLNVGKLTLYLKKVGK